MVAIKQRPFSIIMMAAMQILVAFYSFYLFYLKLKFKSVSIIDVVILVYAAHIFISAIGLLRLDGPGRVLSIVNFSGFAFFSFVGMFLVVRYKLIFCIIFFIVSLFFIFLLTRPNIKQLFRNKALLRLCMYKKKRRENKVIPRDSFSKKLKFAFISFLLLGNFLYLLTFYSVTGYINIFAIILLLIIDFSVVVFIRNEG